MSDDLVKQPALRRWQESVYGKGPYQVPDYESMAAIVQEHESMADRIEELEAENKLLSEGATIAHLRGAMDAHANRADDIWAEFKEWEGERKFALRQIIRWLKNTPGGEAEGE